MDPYDRERDMLKLDALNEQSMYLKDILELLKEIAKKTNVENSEPVKVEVESKISAQEPKKKIKKVSK